MSAVGVARALEEAGIEPQAISVCSGSALWGSMMASGLSAQEMVNQSLNWQPEDYLDIQWTRLPRFAMAAMRGFTGLAKGEAIEKLFDRQLWHMTLGETPIPIYSEVYNIDLNRLETFGSKLTPDLTIAELVRIAIALPLLVESVRVDGHLYADGGVVDVFPAEPLLEHERLDIVVGVNTILPRGLRGRGHLGLDRAHDGLHDRQPPDQLRRPPRAGAAQRAPAGPQADPDRPGRLHRGARLALLRPLHRPPQVAAPDPAGLRARDTRVLDRYRRSSGARKRSRPQAVAAAPYRSATYPPSGR